MCATYDREHGRAYIHELCQKTTIVSGSDFAGLCNPFDFCMGTYCVHCGIADSLSHFVWEDTGEKISVYRRRLRKSSPMLMFWNWCFFPAVGGVVGGVIMVQTKAANIDSLVAFLGGAAVGAMAIYFLVLPVIFRVIGGGTFYQRQ